jgi:ABC-2 type transport system permease protein
VSTAAPTRARVAAQARSDARALLANGEQLLVAVVLPALALVALVAASYPDLGSGRRVDVVAPGVLALAVVSTAFTGQAIATAFDRRSGVLRMLGTTPLGRGGLLAGRIAAVLVVECIQWVVLGGLAVGLGWQPRSSGIPLAVVGLLLGTATFVSLAFLVAGTLRAEAVLAVANLLWVVLLPLGLLLPVDRLPAPAAALAPWTPGGALGELMRSALAGDPTTPWPALGALTAWGVVGAAAAVRWFRWSD